MFPCRQIWKSIHGAKTSCRLDLLAPYMPTIICQYHLQLNFPWICSVCECVCVNIFIQVHLSLSQTYFTQNSPISPSLYIKSVQYAVHYFAPVMEPEVFPVLVCAGSELRPGTHHRQLQYRRDWRSWNWRMCMCPYVHPTNTSMHVRCSGLCFHLESHGTRTCNEVCQTSAHTYWRVGTACVWVRNRRGYRSLTWGAVLTGLTSHAASVLFAPLCQGRGTVCKCSPWEWLVHAWMKPLWSWTLGDS